MSKQLFLCIFSVYLCVKLVKILTLVYNINVKINKLGIFMSRIKFKEKLVEYFKVNIYPVSVLKIQKDLLKDNIKVHISTIYRAINKLVEDGVLEEALEGSDGEKLYKLSSVDKHYIKCINCQKISQIDFCPILDIETKINEKLGYKVLTHRLLFEGLCDACFKECEKNDCHMKRHCHDFIDKKHKH